MQSNDAIEIVVPMDTLTSRPAGTLPQQRTAVRITMLPVSNPVDGDGVALSNSTATF